MAESKNLGADLGRGGDWLYRQGELVLGPVPAKQLMEKLYAGEIDTRTEISPVGQASFRRLAEVELFKIHVAKAEAKRRVEAAERVEQERAARRRNFRIALVTTVALVGGAMAAVAARYLAIYNPFRRGDDFSFEDIIVEPPTITVARARSNEELLEYPIGGGAPVRRPADRGAGSERGRTGSGALADRSSRGTAGGQLNDPGEEPDGLQMAKFDRAAINSVIAAKKPSLYPCFSEEAERNPGFSAKIPIEFVIGNDGRVNKLWVDHPRYKQGALADCLLRELQKWPFKPYPGEQATVGLSFQIGRKGS